MSQPEMWVSWCDDGVTIICSRERCKTAEGYWWQEVVDTGWLQPQHILKAMHQHRDEHDVRTRA